MRPVRLVFAIHAISALLAAALVAGPSAAQAPARDRAFWQAIADRDAALPEGEKAGGLALELVDLLGSTDPKLRDGFGYELLAAWVYRDGRLSPEELEALRKRLVGGLSERVGETGTDSVLRRSFSALDLSVLAAYDLKKPWMSDEAFAATLDAALSYLDAEKDLRGFETGKGWVHAAAHTADLLKFLARSPRLSPAGQRRTVEGVARRLRSAGLVFTWGEDARLAAALLSVVRRKDLDPKPFHDWFAALASENETLWKGELDPAAYVRVRCQLNALAHLAALAGRQEADAVPASFRKALDQTLARTGG